MISNQPQLGQKIDIMLLDCQNKNQKIYFSKIEDMDDQQNYIISAPIAHSIVLPLKVGDKLRLFYYNKRGQFCFNCQVLDVICKNKEISQYKLRRISNINRIQRRNFFRLDINLPVDIYTEDKQLIELARSKNLSGGGIKVISKKQFNQNDIFYLNIKSSYLTDELLKARVVRCNAIDEKYYDAAFEFIDISPAMRECIIKFIFEKERKILEKGL